jgi:chemotaxis protein MotB
MRIPSRTYAVLTALIMTGLLAGCVTKGKYNDLETERNQLQTDQEQLRAQSAELSEQNAALTFERDLLAGDLAKSEEQAARMRGAYDELVGELTNEVESGQVEIEQLMNGVRLNVSEELLFASGSSRVNENGADLLGRVANQISDEQAIITVEGHTDNVAISSKLKGRYPTNWELAAARASSVVRLLSENGVDPGHLRAVSRGPFAPIASNDTAEGRAKNRRTEIILRPIPAQEK